MYEQSDLALIGSRIKAVRTGKGMSQADLAVKASVSLPLISNIERGKTRMQLETSGICGSFAPRRCTGGEDDLSRRICRTSRRLLSQ